MASGIDSELFRDKYGTAEMRNVFSARNTIQQWLNVEAALAEAEAEVGLVPVWAAEVIRSRARAELIPLKIIRARYAIVGYPILPMLEVWEKHLGDEAARWVHWGATTQDVTDTGLVLQISQAIIFLERDLSSLCGLLGSLALRHRDTVMAGRTHGQHAVPITFGFKVSIWLSELSRHSKRLKELRPRLLMGQLSGASGTLASLGDKGVVVQEAMMRGLGLSIPSICWHTSRDAFSEFACWLAMLGSTLERVAHEIDLLQKTEVAELREPYESGKGASSTMPQKRNPATCEAIIALGKLLRNQVPVVMASMTQEHERDWWGIHIEWKSLPEMCVLCSGALDLTLCVLKGLHVDPDKMTENLAISSGLIMAEAVTMRLSQILGHSVAHKVMYEASMRAIEQSCSLRHILEQDSVVTAAISPEDIEQLVNPVRYLGQAAVWVERVATQS